jgi:hypothetical protein
MRLLVFLLIVAATCLAGCSVRADEPWSFVVIPDAMNNDVWLGDSDWYGDNPDGSFNDGTYAAWPFALNAMASEAPDFVLVAGDLVQGRWSLDAFSDAQIQSRIVSDPANFGHLAGLSGVEARQQHIRFMADRTYPDWNQMWANAGIDTVYTIPGDHEFGDNDWNRPYDGELVPVYREMYQQYRPTPEGATAYEGSGGRTFSLTHKNLTLIGIDVFDRNEGGNVSIGLNDNQLAFVENALANSDADHTIAMGHTPILPGVLTRSSSGLMYPGGANSALWQAFRDANVDMYLAGEVHDISMQQRDDILQMVNGTQPSNVPEINYMVVTVYEDRLELELKLLETTLAGPRDFGNDPYLVDPYLARQVKLTQAQYNTGFVTVGTMVIDKSTGQTQFIGKTGCYDSNRYSVLDPEVLSGDVISSLRVGGSTREYVIDSSGFGAGTLVYTDREFAWSNSTTAGNIPAYLEGAEYVRTPNDDKSNGAVQIEMSFDQTTELYVLFDDRVPPANWLTSQFTDTGANLRYLIDESTQSAGTWSVWRTTVAAGDDITLGANATSGSNFGMYAIAAVAVPNLPGDFNDDGVVDAADYTVWRDNRGAPTDIALNGNGDGVPGVSLSDYEVWRSNFGATSGSLQASASVPEPAAVWLLGVCLLLAWYR